ncbi:hypothetical protein [Rhodocyclus tenuis]|uniref:hypothetical protein n=1 Tax=Rhodocyclus tenuis TaxID=1066 RepID=UPI001906F835|nr:hypothetical protein [Rhodocyclus tenuis]
MREDVLVRQVRLQQKPRQRALLPRAWSAGTSLTLLLACMIVWPDMAVAADGGFARRFEQRGDFPQRDAQPRETRFASDSWAQPVRREGAAYNGYPPGDAPEASRPGRFSSEERRQLRRDLHEAGRDLYAPRR